MPKAGAGGKAADALAAAGRMSQVGECVKEGDGTEGAFTRNVLFICAHDDDEAIGAGGTIRKLADAGTRVVTLIFAEGNEGYSQLAERYRIVEERRKERAEAQKILGTAECVAHSYHDFANLDCEEVYREIMRVVRLVRPSVVFTHAAGDYLSHQSLAAVAPEAVQQAGWLCSLELGEPWRVERLYHFPIMELMGRPSHIVDITGTFEAKLRAMKAYRSQHRVIPGILEQLETKARASVPWWGCVTGSRSSGRR